MWQQGWVNYFCPYNRLKGPKESPRDAHFTSKVFFENLCSLVSGVGVDRKVKVFMDQDAAIYTVYSKTEFVLQVQR